MNTQKVDGSTLCNALELSFKTVDTTSILTTRSIDISQSIDNKAAVNHVYNNHEVGLRFSSLIGAAPAILDTIVELAAALGNDSNYAATIQNQSVNKADNNNHYSKTDVDVFLSMFQAVITNRVWINIVDINGKVLITAVSDDILKIQRVDGSIVYDAFELSFNDVN